MLGAEVGELAALLSLASLRGAIFPMA